MPRRKDYRLRNPGVPQAHQRKAGPMKSTPRVPSEDEDINEGLEEYEEDDPETSEESGSQD